VEPLSSITSQDVVNFFIKVFSRHGAPEIITTDNGAQLTSDFTKIFLDLYYKVFYDKTDYNNTKTLY